MPQPPVPSNDGQPLVGFDQLVAVLGCLTYALQALVLASEASRTATLEVQRVKALMREEAAIAEFTASLDDPNVMQHFIDGGDGNVE